MDRVAWKIDGIEEAVDGEIDHDIGHAHASASDGQTPAPRCASIAANEASL